MTISILKRQFYALKSLIIGFLVLAGMLIPFFYSSANPSTIFEDDFETYNLGNLNGQGGWGTVNFFQVSDTRSFPANTIKSMKTNACPNYSKIEKDGQQTYTGRITYYLWIDEGLTSNPVIQFSLWQSGNSGIYTKIVCSAGDCYFWYWNGETGYTQYPDLFPTGSWQSIEIEFDTATTDRYRVRWAKNDWTGWVKFYNQQNLAYLNRVQVMTMSGLADKWYLDYISENPFSISGYEPMIEPEIPEDCQNTIMDFDDAQFKGTISIPSENENVFTDLKIVLLPLKEMGEKTIDLEMPELTGGQSWQWNKTDLNIHDHDSYEVIYMASGYNPNTMEYFTYFHRGESVCGQKTKIFHGQVGWTEIPVEEWKGAEIEQREDCSQYDWITNMGQRLFCELGNFTKDILFPSNAKIWELKENLNQFKTKFPFNYINEIDSFFKDIKNSLSEEKEIPVKIFGHQANVNFDFWEKTGEVGGIVESFGSLIKDFMTLILVIGFLTWLLSFIRRFW